MVKITSNGFVSFNYNIMGNSYILSVLGEPLQLEEDFTLRSFFKMFINYPQLVNLESSILDYVYLYNTELQYNEVIENKHIIKYNSYLVNEPEKVLSIRHNLTVFTNQQCKNKLKIEGFQIEELLDSKIVLNNIIKGYLIEKSEDGNKVLRPTNEDFNVEDSCSLYDFIIWFSGAFFKGENPETRRKFVNNHNSKAHVNTYNLMKEIETIIKS